MNNQSFSSEIERFLLVHAGFNNLDRDTNQSEYLRAKSALEALLARAETAARIDELSLRLDSDQSVGERIAELQQNTKEKQS